MVFAAETEVETSSDTAPLSPEQVANAQAKNALLNESLGIEKDIDPTSGDETEDDDESFCFSALDLESVAQKNTELGVTLKNQPPLMFNQNSLLKLSLLFLLGCKLIQQKKMKRCIW